MSNFILDDTGSDAAGLDVLLLSETGAAITAAKGMRVVPHASIADCGPLDILLVPGGRGQAREVDNAPLVAWIRETGRSAAWTTSVCTGTFLLAAAGLLRDRRVTTHWHFIDQLRARDDVGEVLADARYVRDGNLVTSAGVSAGIDMALWLVGQLYSPDHARATQRRMEYDPAPPYQAVV